ncbi:MAG: DNA polymerase I [Bryobacteraceae bacterium]
MPRLFLVDAFNLIFRAYHARQRTGAPPMRTSRGSSTEAIYIFHNMIRRLQKQYAPEYLAAVFESEGPTFRDQQYEAYKANRAETPPELIEQIPAIERMLGAMRVPVLKTEGYEADDVIGTVARKAAAAGIEVWMISSDKDLLQLVGDGIRMMDPMKNDTLYDPAKVEEFKGVPPERIADLLALVGDTSDNIPGAPGIGEKGAVQLLREFGSLEALLERAAEVGKKSYRESLLQNREQIELSKRLATIETDVPLEVDLEALRVQPPDVEALAAFYREYEFLSFLKELQLPAAEGAAMEEAAGDEPDTAVFYDWKAAGCPETGKPVEDVLLYAFLVLADPSACALDSLIARYLERAPATREETLRALARRLRPLVTGDLRRLYDEVDLPLMPVLLRMERTGVRIDTERLAALSREMEARLERLTEEIYALAGTPFNINSPKQLGEVLFERLGLQPQGKTTKTKAYSTSADVLEALAGAHPIVGRILDYRQISKLKGTYVDALPQLISPEDGRLHTTFNPAGAATGRLSSADPNLQNIPVRTELGREIRSCFVPESGWVLLSADYSQIELRLLAHFSGDAALVEAFRNNEDIHTRTASEIHGVPPLMVTPEMRRAAKAVNFGIVYGQTPFGLAQQLGIPQEQAREYIQRYFERYPGVRMWIDRTVEEVRERGYTLTLWGRRRPIPDIASKNPNARAFAERTAVNTPLQGTAADLMRKAMIVVDGELRRRGWRSRLLLQVHDELVLECPPEELEEARAMVKRAMEGVEKLAVPLLAETAAGPNWRDVE